MANFFKVFFVFFIFFNSLFAEENKDVTFLFPVDWSVEPHVNLSVRIPKQYKPVQPPSDWNTAELIEFIPKEEDVSDWSEIITIQKLINRKISADQLTSLLIGNLSRTVNVTVLSKENSDKKFQEDTFILKYNYNGRDEVLGAKYLSGPYDSIGVQYTIRLNEGISEEKAIEKIRSYFEKELQVI